jgi:hypothetical protein
MDIFVFKDPGTSFLLSEGKLVSDIKSIMWIERYRDAGEFTIKARIDSDIRNELPIGACIAHTNSDTVMLVENQEINEQGQGDLEISVTGRSIETILDQRTIGQNNTWPATSYPIPDYLLAADYTWNQAVLMIKHHLIPGSTIDANDAVQGLLANHDVPAGTSGQQVARIIKPGSVYAAILELLASDSLGIRAIRPGPWSPMPSNPEVLIQVHKGTDRTKTVIFSNASGDIDNADYLWSNKKFKNCALVMGRWVDIMIKATTTDQIGRNRRVLYVEAGDIDQAFSAPPTGSDLTNVQAALTNRGYQALAAQRQVALAKAQAARNLKTYLYRKDFFVGDIVTVNGEYNETTTMRVTEYVEIWDEHGESGYPTFSDA